MLKRELNLLPIKNDYVFKRVFSYKGNEDVLLDLLEAILKRKITKVEVRNPEMVSEKENGKKFILDIKAELDDGTIVDIEMQTVDERNIQERSIAYSARMVSEQLQSGEEYTRLNKVIFIGILDFEYYKRNSYYHVARPRFDEIEEEYFVEMGYKKQEELASKYVEMHYIELPKYFKKNPIMKTKLDEWLWLFSEDEERMKMVERKNKKVKKAMNTLERISLDPKEIEMYESIQTEEFLQRISENNIREEGREEGRKEGERKKETEIVKEMLKDSVNVERIKKYTKLTKEEIEEIRKNS